MLCKNHQEPAPALSAPTGNAWQTLLARPQSTLKFIIPHDASLSTACTCLQTALNKLTFTTNPSLNKSTSDTASYQSSAHSLSLSWMMQYWRHAPIPSCIFLPHCFVALPFPHTLHIFSFKHFRDDVSHWGDKIDILQSAIYVTKWFLAMDGCGHQQFLTPKIGIWKSKSGAFELFFWVPRYYFSTTLKNLDRKFSRSQYYS